MGGGGGTEAEVGGGAGGAIVLVVAVVVLSETDEVGGVGEEVVGGDIGVVETVGSDRGEGFEDEVAGDAVRMVDPFFGRFDFDLSVSVFPASPISSLNPNFNSSGTFSPACPFPTSLRDRSSSPFKISSFFFPPHPIHCHVLLSHASLLRSPSPISIPPTWPLAPPSMKARNAQSAVRIPQAGCHVSS